MSLNEFPPRKSGSNILWRHLLNLDADSSINSREPAIIVPPAPPLDKNAASMRILLHDTQANFEKFAAHAEALLEDISATRLEIKTANSLFEKERETMLGDIVDLVNRSQREVIKTVGQPVQRPDLETFSKDVFHRFDGLHQQLEKLHAQSQAHAQSLQSQMQTFQLLLDKQSSIYAAVTPLLPLLQTLPLLIDSIKTVISDGFSKLTAVQAGSTSASATESHTAGGADNISTNLTSTPCPIQNLKRARSISPSQQNIIKGANSPGVSTSRSPKKRRMEPPQVPILRNSPAPPTCAPHYVGPIVTTHQERTRPAASNTSGNHLVSPHISRNLHPAIISPRSAMMTIQSPRRNVNGLTEPSLCRLSPVNSTLEFPVARAPESTGTGARQNLPLASNGEPKRSAEGSSIISSGTPARVTSYLTKDGTVSKELVGQPNVSASSQGPSGTRHDQARASSFISDSLTRRPSLFSMEHTLTRVGSWAPHAAQHSPQTPRRALHVGARPQPTTGTPGTASVQRLPFLGSTSRTNTAASRAVSELGRVCNLQESKSSSSTAALPSNQAQGRRFISLVDSDDDGDSEDMVEGMIS